MPYDQSQSPHPALFERRIFDRHRTLRGAVLTFNKGYSAFECMVKNQSRNGAKLAFGETMAVPNRFDIQIAGDDTRHTARVCWRTATEIGVSLD